MENMPGWVQEYLPFFKSVMIAVIIFIVGWIISKWAGMLVLKLCRNRKVDEAVGRFLSTIAAYSVMIAAVISSLGAVGVETTSLVAVFASAGLAIGLALQGNLSNFASGVMILIFRPIELGNKIKVSGTVGDVMDIGLFTTVLQTFENEKVIVPNSTITGGMIVNYSHPGILRGGVDVSIAYGSDVAMAMDTMLKAAKRAKYVIADPGAHVAFVKMGASSLDFTVYAWCNSANYRDMFHTVRTAIHADLVAADIKIPFNQLVIHKAD